MKVFVLKEGGLVIFTLKTPQQFLRLDSEDIEAVVFGFKDGELVEVSIFTRGSGAEKLSKFLRGQSMAENSTT